MTKTNTKAFTLIELLIVIVIIGILAVALIPRLTGAQATARDTARKAALQQGSTVISSFLAQETSPGAISATTFTGTMPTNFSNYGTLPTADAQGKPYYIIPSGTNDYIVCVDLEKSGQGNVDKANCAAVASGDVAGSNTGSTYIIRVRS